MLQTVKKILIFSYIIVKKTQPSQSAYFYTDNLYIIALLLQNNKHQHHLLGQLK
jgi:hypothetical protein